MPYQTLGQRIKTARKKTGLSQKALVGDRYSVTYLGKVERDQSLPSAAFIDFIAPKLGLDPAELKALLYNPDWKDPMTEAQEIELYNAYVALATGQPGSAKNFLARLNPEELPGNLLPRYRAMLGEAQARSGEYRAAQTSLQQALVLLQASQAIPALEVERTRNWLGLAFYYNGQYRQALEQHQLCLEMIKQKKITDKKFKMLVYANIGNELHFVGDSRNSLVFFKKALQLADQREDRLELAAIYWEMGYVYEALSDFALSKHYLNLSGQEYEAQNQPKNAAIVKSMLGRTMGARGEIEEAEEVLAGAVEFGERCGDPQAKIGAYSNLAYIFELQGKFQKAEEMAGQALENALILQKPILTGQVLAQLAKISVVLEKYNEAQNFFEEAIRQLEQTEAQKYLHKTCYEYSNALEQKGQLREAYNMLLKACEYQTTASH